MRMKAAVRKIKNGTKGTRAYAQLILTNPSDLPANNPISPSKMISIAIFPLFFIEQPVTTNCANT